MLQRVPNNGYSWWWASHIRTKQSKWLDSNLREMDDTVKNMIKLVEADADSFAKRAELYFKRRPELISYVEDAYRAYRALAERFDSISSELHKANHTIATSCPEQVQYAMLEEQDDDNLPKAITPVDPGRINKRTVEGILKKRRESESSIRKTQNKKPTSEIDTEMAQEEINILQKGILVLQSEKQFIKSSYEGGIAKYWEIEKQIMDMQEKVCYLQDGFDTSAVVEDDEARALTTATALKSCEDAIVRLQEQRKESLEQAKAESERVKIAKEKLKALKGECGQSETENANMSSESTEMNFTAENMEKEADSLNNARLELQSISEKIKEYFKMNPESSAVEIAEKINELVIKVTTLELTVSSQAVQINRLTSESSELEKNLQNLEEEKIILINDSNVLTKRLEDAEEELSKVQAIEKIIRDEEMNYRENFAEACHSLNGISEKLQPPKPLENACDEHACLEDEVSTGSIEPQGACEDKEVTQIQDIKGDLAEDIHVTQPLGHFLGDVFQAKDSQESIALEEMMALITELKNVIAMKDEEIRLLRLELASLKMSSNGSAAAVEDHSQQILESKSNSAMLTNNLNLQDSEMPEDLNMESTTKSDSSVEGMGVPPIEEFRRDVDTLLGKGLAFWLRFSTSFHHVQQLQAKYEDLQADINKLKDNKTQKGNDTVANDRDGKAESALMATRLKELKTELHEWSERSALLRGDLQSRFSSLSNMQEEISTVANTNSKSGEALFTTYKAARLQGEVRNMKQENNKAASELQVGLHQVRRLQTEIEELLARLYRRFEPFVSLNHASSSTGVPLRVFLYGSNSKPKKPSIFARIHPLFWKNSKLRAGHRSK